MLRKIEATVDEYPVPPCARQPRKLSSGTCRENDGWKRNNMGYQYDKEGKWSNTAFKQVRTLHMGYS